MLRPAVRRGPRARLLTAGARRPPRKLVEGRLAMSLERAAKSDSGSVQPGAAAGQLRPAAVACHLLGLAGPVAVTAMPS